jgi:hypothetical protein
MKAGDAFQREIEVLRRSWAIRAEGAPSPFEERGAFLKLKGFYFRPEEFEEVLCALRTLPSLASGELPLEAVRYLWRMNEYLLVYRANYLPSPTTRFASGGPVDIQNYDRLQARMAVELHRILGAPVTD